MLRGSPASPVWWAQRLGEEQALQAQREWQTCQIVEPAAEVVQEHIVRVLAGRGRGGGGGGGCGRRDGSATEPARLVVDLSWHLHITPDTRRLGQDQPTASSASSSQLKCWGLLGIWVPAAGKLLFECFSEAAARAVCGEAARSV